ncbi:protein DBF4 homolog B-like [Colius striatus]|uniref:protein DBF4 homolog B-like n=1 Tax=Colius striatus TaxID=57412 RepID=UPI002B1E3726|nr:protein DBF4 homolog B-like [Colius striatus]
MAGPAARPLRGKSFYLDVPSGPSARQLAAVIGRLGGVTENFLSKEVTYVVSSNREAKGGKGRAWAERRSSTSAKDAKATGPVPSASKGTQTRPHQKPPDAVLISRGKELLQKAMKNQDTCSGSSILANARLWGVQILHVDEMLSYTQQLLHAVPAGSKRSQESEAKCPASRSKTHKGKLKPPFLKVEDQSRQFRPFHHQFKSFPNINFLAPKSSSPFEPLKSFSNSCRARGVEGSPGRSAGEKSPRSTPVTVPRRRRGFCECCQETFEELQKHLRSPGHERFARDASHYAALDRLIAQLLPRVPGSCLTAERAAPHTPVAGGTQMLTAQLRWDREQPEPGAVELGTATEHHRGLKTESCSPCLPRDRVSNPRGGGGVSKDCSGGLPAGGACAARDPPEGSAPGGLDGSSAPGLGWGTHRATAHRPEATAASSEPLRQQVPGAICHLPPALPTSRKRRLSSRRGTPGKRPRLELAGGGFSACGQRTVVEGELGGWGAGQMPEPGCPRVLGAGNVPSSTQLSNTPHGCLGSGWYPCGRPGHPVSGPGSLQAVSGAVGPAEPAAAHECGQGRLD